MSAAGVHGRDGREDSAGPRQVNPPRAIEVATARRFGRISRACAAFGVALGVWVLLGWILGVPFMRNLLPGFLSVKANSSIAFILLGCSMWILLRQDASRAARNLAVAFALIGLVFGLVTLFESAAGVDLHFDQILFKEPANAPWTASPGRPSVTAALCFVLISLSLLALRMRKTSAVQLLAGAACAIATMSLLTFLLGASRYRAFGDFYTTIPLLATVGFLALSVGLLLARPGEGPMAVFASGGTGGRIAWRIVPTMVVVLIGVATVLTRGEHRGLFTTEYRHNLEIMASLLLLTLLVGFVARRLDFTEGKRRQMEDDLARSEATFRAVFEGSRDGLLAADVQTRRFALANDAICQMLGYTHAEMLALGVENIHPAESLPHVAEQFDRQVRDELDLLPTDIVDM